MSAFSQIDYRVEDRVAVISLARPDKMNGLTRVMEGELYDAMQMADRDDGVRAIVLTGQGRAFCAGMDMGELEHLAPDDIYDPARMRPFDTARRADFQTRYTYFPGLDTPVIAAINGAAAGLGMVFALCADMRFCSQTALFSTAFSRRGLIAEHGIAWLLSTTVGAPRRRPGSGKNRPCGSTLRAGKPAPGRDGLCARAQRTGVSALRPDNETAIVGGAFPGAGRGRGPRQPGNGEELRERGLQGRRSPFCGEAPAGVRRTLKQACNPVETTHWSALRCMNSVLW